MVNGIAKNEIDVLLANSLKELAQTKPIEKITIKEITDKAGVIRPTFYNHFQDKFDLLEWIIITDLLVPIYPLIKAGMITEAMLLLFTNLQKQGDFYKRAVKIEGPVTFHDVDMKCVTRMLKEILEESSQGKASKHKWLSADVVATYYAQSMCFAAEKWVSQGMPYTPQEMADAYYHIITHSMEDIIEEL